MADEQFIPIGGLIGKNLDAVRLNQTDGTPVLREGVFVGDPDTFAARAGVTNTTPATDAYGLVTRPILSNQSLGVGDLTVDAWGSQKMSLPFSLFSGMFTFDIPQTKWMMYENGTQVYTSTDIVSENGEGVLRTTATNSTLLIESRTCPRYQSNRGHLFSTAGWFPSKTNDGIREWGVGTAENRVNFRLKSDGLLYAVQRSGNVETHEQLIDTSGVTGFDVEKGNVYDIQYQWRGVGNYYFYVNLKLVHTFSHLGTLTALSMENPALPVRLAAQRTTQDVEAHFGCVDITSENGAEAKLEYGSAYAAAVATGTDKPIIVVKQPLLINSETNTRDLTLTRITMNCTKKATFKVWSTRDATAFTGPTFVSVNQGSFVESDSPDMAVGAVRATAVDTAKLRFVTAVNVEANVSREVTNPDPIAILFPIVRGDYIVVTVTASSATADCVIEWGEHI